MDEENKQNRSNAGDIAKGLAVGAAVGAAAGVLLAPQSGKETRDDISDKLKEGADTAREKFEDVKEKLTQVQDDLRSRFEDQLTELESRINHLQNNYEGDPRYDEISEMRDDIKYKLDDARNGSGNFFENIKDKVQTAIDDLKDRIDMLEREDTAS